MYISDSVRLHFLNSIQYSCKNEKASAIVFFVTPQSSEGIGVKATLYTLPRTGWGKTVFETVTYPFHAPQS